MVNFLHLSDIHFREYSNDNFDTDGDLRNEIELDAKRFAETHFVPDAILVSGDIAFSGQEDEYSIAKDWLSNLASLVKCEETSVWCVPGNHDVDQSVIKKSKVLESTQAEVRNVANTQSNELDSYLRSLMTDELATEFLFKPIEQYNKFAATFGCEILPEKQVWQEKFILDDGSELRLNGLMSTLCSNHLDNEKGFIVVGEYQIPEREDGVVDVIMCHHPHDWIRSSTGFFNKANSRAHLQLFGHKHIQSMDRMNDSLHLVAGAVHPDKRESNWVPRYNWISISIEVDSSRKLKIRVYPRIWSEDKTQFQTDHNRCEGREFLDYVFELPMWERQLSENIVVDVSGNQANDENGMSTSIDHVPEGKAMDPARTLAYRFFGLSHTQRIEIAIRLKLLNDTDEGIEDHELYNRIFDRAKTGDVLSQLWDAIEHEYSDGKHDQNPFD
ncbi:metallophosphoesterase [Gimesia panareensis]|uniref:metallophosphoesterase n=1 Tax=Gimesia panareensis TaxID=2527978 RepID=UPI00118D461E|nr:metallophosphoesterase [Gimesia panareensis]QDU53000.1 Calcineurin-like phosphoesterase superfamily domain protein [Gimesia panareensis]